MILVWEGEILESLVLGRTNDDGCGISLWKYTVEILAISRHSNQVTLTFWDRYLEELTISATERKGLL